MVENIIKVQATRFGVKIAEFANVGNHLHLCLRFTSRPAFKDFLRSTCALIARKITGARRGHPFGKFWDDLAFTRVVVVRIAERILKNYIEANVVEGAWGKEARENYLRWATIERKKWIAAKPTPS